MTTLVRTDGLMLGALHGALGKSAGLAPYARDIPLLACHVAGTTYRALDTVAHALAVGEPLTLVRDPKNPHDPRAVKVLRADTTDLGYLPRDKNEVIANLMDAGKHLSARLLATRKFGEWLRLDIEVVLDDR